MTEYQILTGLKKQFNQINETIDIATYKIIDRYLKNPFNSSKEDLAFLTKIIGEEQVRFDVYSLAPNKKKLLRTIKHIMPCKLSKAISPIKTINGNVRKEKLHIPVFTKKLEIAA